MKKHSFILTNLVNSLLLKLAILISGRGSNMKSEAVKKQNIPIKPTVVISNKPICKGIKDCKKAWRTNRNCRK